ncbi:MAG: hypothetical protein CMF49_06915 [Legionellales bacterium]|nr:hypothetical protein [Legionellales bacterium]|tara:strand:+ start:57 stop:470 length:414 start_codon:yes stop_codon:yes gene_type:complete
MLNETRPRFTFFSRVFNVLGAVNYLQLCAVMIFSLGIGFMVECITTLLNGMHAAAINDYLYPECYDPQFSTLLEKCEDELYSIYSQDKESNGRMYRNPIVIGVVVFLILAITYICVCSYKLCSQSQNDEAQRIINHI